MQCHSLAFAYSLIFSLSDNLQYDNFLTFLMLTIWQPSQEDAQRYQKYGKEPTENVNCHVRAFSHLSTIIWQPMRTEINKPKLLVN